MVNKDDERLFENASIRTDLVNSNEQMEETCYGDVKNNQIVIASDGFPARVTLVKSSKTGKHGTPKITLNLSGLFTKKTFVDQNAYNKQILVPEIKKTDYEVYTYEEEEIQVFQEDSGDFLTFKLYNNAKESNEITKRLEDEEKVFITVTEAQCLKNEKLTKVHLVEISSKKI